MATCAYQGRNYYRVKTIDALDIQLVAGKRSTSKGRYSYLLAFAFLSDVFLKPYN